MWFEVKNIFTLQAPFQWKACQTLQLIHVLPHQIVEKVATWLMHHNPKNLKSPSRKLIYNYALVTK